MCFDKYPHKETLNKTNKHIYKTTVHVIHYDQLYDQGSNYENKNGKSMIQSIKYITTVHIKCTWTQDH